MIPKSRNFSIRLSCIELNWAILPQMRFLISIYELYRVKFKIYTGVKICLIQSFEKIISKCAIKKSLIKKNYWEKITLAKNYKFRHLGQF